MAIGHQRCYALKGHEECQLISDSHKSEPLLQHHTNTKRLRIGCQTITCIPVMYIASTTVPYQYKETENRLLNHHLHPSQLHLLSFALDEYYLLEFRGCNGSCRGRLNPCVPHVQVLPLNGGNGETCGLHSVASAPSNHGCVCKFTS